METNNTILKIEGLHRWLGENEMRVHVLKGVNLEVASGRVYSIVGPSGCGKSTLLYLMGLLDYPDQGNLILNGADVGSLSDDDRTSIRGDEIGFVFQFHFLLNEFSALENVMLPMKKLGELSEEEMKERALHLLETVGLGSKVDRLANQLSGGEQQRVAIARALANNPSLILADEPTGNLDIKNSNTIFETLKDIAKKEGPAIVIVTHNQELAEQSDEVLRMQDGVFLG